MKTTEIIGNCHLYLGDCREVVPTDVYGGTFRMLHKVFEPIGCTVTNVDFGDLDAVRRVITSQTKLVWLESPTNPRLLIYDIKAIAEIAHAKGALVVVDNTFATPYFQKPFDLDAVILGFFGAHEVITLGVVRDLLEILAGALGEDIRGGEAIGPDGRKQRKGAPAVVEPFAEALDQAKRERLWAVSEESCGIGYGF